MGYGHFLLVREDAIHSLAVRDKSIDELTWKSGAQS